MMYGTINLVIKMKNDTRESFIKFVDENVVGKAKTVEQFNESLGIVRRYLELKGELSEEAIKYLDSLISCASELISMRSKGIEFSTANLFAKGEVYKPEKSLDVGCASDMHTYHYTSGC